MPAPDAVVRLHLPMTTAALTLLLLLLGAAASEGQPRTDVVTLANGDRITGEVIRLERGRLEFKTDDAGTLYLEWDNVASVVSVRLVQVVAIDGQTYLGALARAADRSVSIVSGDLDVTLPLSEITLMTPIGQNFWRKLDGSIDAGFSYTKSSAVAQLNLNAVSAYRRPKFLGRVSLTLTQTEQSDGSKDDRGAAEISYVRYPWPKWFISAVGRFETNESLGLELRSQIAGAIGPRLVNSNRAQLVVGGGLAVNDEQGVDVGSSQNVEGLLLFSSSFYTYDRPKTNVDVNVFYYPSLSQAGRQRLQVDAGAKREFFKDLFLAVNVYDTFDSHPPNPSAERNDVGVVTSIGWSY